MPPLAPMLARAVKRIPRPDSADGGLLYEPKWDGFRCIVFRDGDEVELGSRNERPLTRYFPEVVAAVKERLPRRCVVDCEVVIRSGPRLEFDALLNRIHPAASRVDLLSRETPASLVVFDLLALGDESLMETGFGRRRELLTERVAPGLAMDGGVHVTPATDRYELAEEWFDAFEGAGLDGVVAKPRALPYKPDQRAMYKIKHERTADCVVAGYRHHKSGPVVGSLLLGLYDDAGKLQHVGVSASFTMRRRAELIGELEPYFMDSPDGHPWASWRNPDGGTERMPGAVSRWNAGKDLGWIPLRPELVCEVAYEHMQSGRFRHTARFRRWRPDRAPESCTYAQLDEPVAYDLDAVFAGAAGNPAGSADKP